MITWEELSELTKTRRSIRRFEDKPVPEDLLLKALELATWAPNGGNQQPWRFLIVSNGELIGKMADAVKAKTELMASWPEAEQFEETVARWRKSSDFFRGAPVCIVVLMGKYSSIADQILQARGETEKIFQHCRPDPAGPGGDGPRCPADPIIP
ncbi:MAG: nitroreductase family protein [Deltaproteobacteria bacterium]|nr:nitroreductase family protein [Deltaproteobacteria bacterium]